MFARAAFVLVLAVSVSGCANERFPSPMALGFHGNDTAPTASLTGHAGEPSGDRSGDKGGHTGKVQAASRTIGDVKNMKQTLGGKVLSAIALERVTGMKPDPRRFRELH